MKAILGKKIEMTQIFDEQGRVVPVTILQVRPMTVTQIKTSEKDGYSAIQAGLKQIAKPKKSKKAAPFTHLKEFKVGEGESFQAGSSLDVSLFQEGDMVTVAGVSKGKGFQGGVKRHGFAGRNSTHGVKHEQRTIGSVGGRFPQRVIKGRRMPGQAGRSRITVKNLQVMKIDAEHSLMAVKGAVPGARGTLLEIRGSHTL
ncbi:MAG: 50S ribosomal protein L3 [Candidatus Yanofskybacteria bacterium]|nr:50S ribosomal protein L3 [Candidatus Yanofskybacteria bacterium]